MAKIAVSRLQTYDRASVYGVSTVPFALDAIGRFDEWFVSYASLHSRLAQYHSPLLHISTCGMDRVIKKYRE